MQQPSLFQLEKKNFQKGNLSFEISTTELENVFIWTLQIPSGKFIVKYSLDEFSKINSFEIIDYSWYLYITIPIIKNIKTLIELLIKNS